MVASIQKTNGFDYALIFSLYGIEFPADNKLADPGKVRRNNNRNAEIRKKKVKLSRISCIASSESVSSLDEMYRSPVIIDNNLEEYMDDMVDEWFEHHLQYDTLPKLYDILNE